MKQWRFVLIPIAQFAAISLMVVSSQACGNAASTSMESDVTLPMWTLEEELRIGAVDGGDQNLTRVTGILPLPDGRVWIMQTDDHQFRVYGADGAFLGTVGERGQGPGEFVAPAEVGWWGPGRDTIWVYDLIPRYSLFTRDGEFLRTLDPEPISYEARWVVRRPEAVLDSGRAVGIAGTQIGEDLGESRVLSYDITAGVPVLELARLARASSVRYSPTQGMTATIPIPDNELVAFAADGGWFVVVDRHAQGMPGTGYLPVHAIGARGDTLWSRQFQYDPLPLLQSEIDTIEARRAGMRTFLTGRGGRPPAEAEQRSQLITIPGHRPPVERVLIGEDDTVWIEWAASPGQHGNWLVLSDSGEPLATVEHSHRVDAFTASRGQVWAVLTDALDVPYVVRYRVTH